MKHTPEQLEKLIVKVKNKEFNRVERTFKLPKQFKGLIKLFLNIHI